MKIFDIENGNSYFVLESDISLSDRVVSYYPDDTFFFAFLQLDGYSSYQDSNGNWVRGRDLDVLYYDITKDRLIPYDRSNKYNVGIYIWYIKS